MKIAVAQIQPIKGNVPAYVALYLSWIKTAVDQGAVFIVFPELSLTS